MRTVGGIRGGDIRQDTLHAERDEVTQTLLRLEKADNCYEKLNFEERKKSKRTTRNFFEYFLRAGAIAVTIFGACYSNSLTGLTRRNTDYQNKGFLLSSDKLPYASESNGNYSLEFIYDGIDANTERYVPELAQSYPDPSEMTPRQAADLVSYLYVSFLIHEDLDAKIVCYDHEFKEKDPFLYKGLMRVLYEMREDLNSLDLSNYKLPMPDNSGGGIQFIEMLVGGAGAALNYTDFQNEQLRKLLIENTQLDEDTLHVIPSPYPEAKNMLQVVNSSLNNFCLLNPTEGCDHLTYIRQTEEGKYKDIQEGRAETYASIVPWGPILRSNANQIFFTDLYANMLQEAGKDIKYYKKNKDLIKIILLHELTHRMGTIDIYVCIEKIFNNTFRGESPDMIFDAMRDFIDNIEDNLDEIPTPVIRDVVAVYSRYVKKYGLDHNEYAVNNILNKDFLSVDKESLYIESLSDYSKESVMNDIKEQIASEPRFKAELVYSIADVHAVTILEYFYNIPKESLVHLIDTTPSDEQDLI